jgi:ABC-2 type transport system permease protein
MKAYWAVISARFRALLQYRAAAVAGFATQLFWGLIRVMIFTAFYESSTAKQPMSAEEVVTYVWLGQAFFRLLPWDIEGDIRQMIRTGDVAYELLRPLDMYWLWYCRALAWRTAPTLLRALPLLVIALPFLGMQGPASVASGGAFLVAMVGAVCLAAAITTLIGITLLWSISGEGISRLVSVAVLLLSGMMLPLPLFPGWAQGSISVLPFRGVVDLPFRLYMGNLPPEQVLGVLAHQVVWIAGLAVFGRWLLGRGVRRLAVQGG